jgi:predicted trehalose synthase
MTENETTDEAEAQNVEVDLAAPDEVAYDELVDQFGQELIDADLEEVVKERVRSLYDNQDAIRQRIAQAQQQAAGGPQ